MLEHITAHFLTEFHVIPKGDESVLVVVDKLSQGVLFIPTTKDVTSQEVYQLFEAQGFSKHGVFSNFTSDRTRRSPPDTGKPRWNRRGWVWICHRQHTLKQTINRRYQYKPYSTLLDRLYGENRKIGIDCCRNYNSNSTGRSKNFLKNHRSKWKLAVTRQSRTQEPGKRCSTRTKRQKMIWNFKRRWFRLGIKWGGGKRATTILCEEDRKVQRVWSG